MNQERPTYFALPTTAELWWRAPDWIEMEIAKLTRQNPDLTAFAQPILDNRRPVIMERKFKSALGSSKPLDLLVVGQHAIEFASAVEENFGFAFECFRKAFFNACAESNYSLALRIGVSCGLETQTQELVATLIGENNKVGYKTEAQHIFETYYDFTKPREYAQTLLQQLEGSGRRSQELRGIATDLYTAGFFFEAYSLLAQLMADPRDGLALEKNTHPGKYVELLSMAAVALSKIGELPNVEFLPSGGLYLAPRN